MEHLIKRTVCIIFLLMLILPALQFKLNIIKMVPLGGNNKYEPRPNFFWDSLMLNRYQKKYEQYVNDHVGFRELFLRSYNQVWYSCFNQLHAWEAVMGKNNCLYELNYINAYTGQDFIGKTAIDEELRKAKFVQDTLAKKNIHLVLLFAAGKASFFPENIPDKYLKNASTETNYKYYIQGCMKCGVNYLDLNKYFISLKGKTPYPIFSNVGIHWTNYGAILAYDTLIRYLGHLQGAPLPRMVIDSIHLSNKALKSDDDIEQGINLLLPLSHPVLAYPRYHFINVPGMKKPSLLTIADSYWWTIFGEGITLNTFRGSSFWFYGHEAYYDYDRASASVFTLDLQQEVEQYDFVIFEATEANYCKIDYYIIDQLYDIYKGKVNPVMEHRRFEEAVKKEEEAIKNVPEWFEQVKEGAIQHNVPLDTMIRRNAIFMVVKKRTNKAS